MIRLIRGCETLQVAFTDGVKTLKEDLTGKVSALETSVKEHEEKINDVQNKWIILSSLASCLAALFGFGANFIAKMLGWQNH